MLSNRPGWAGYRDLIATRIIDLADGDTVRLTCEVASVGFHQQTDRFAVDATADRRRPFSPRQRAAMRALGWTPVASGDLVWQCELPWPFPAAGAARIADLIVATIRDVYGVAGTVELDIEARNIVTGERLAGWDEDGGA